MNLKASILWISLVIFTCEIDALRGPSKCCRGPNEVYTDCGPSCGGDACSPIIYKQKCNQTCEEGCFCKCGFFRNSDGICVRPQECPGGSPTNIDYPKNCPGEQCCGDFEYFGESNSCVDQCPLPNQSCIQSIEPGCYCLPGYRRERKSGVCVPNNLCPSPQICKDPNSEPGCESCQTCKQQIAIREHTILAPCSIINCSADSCKCKQGFYKDDITESERCISYEQCLALDKPKCPEFEEPGCDPCNSCERALSNETDTCTAKCTKDACRCVAGRHRNSDRKCVTLDECKSEVLSTTELASTTLEPTVDPQDCPEFEIPGCYPCQTCSRFLNGKLKDPCPVPCSPCMCAGSRFRNKTGSCVTIRECENEVGTTNTTPSFNARTSTPIPFVCPNFMEVGCNPCKTCKNLREGNKEEINNCSIPCTSASNACKCSDGYYFDENGRCVTEEECQGHEFKTDFRGTEVILDCTVNETRTGHTNCQSCEEGIQISEGNILPCESERLCMNPLNKCVCKPGYYRNSENQCVSLEDCKAEVIPLPLNNGSNKVVLPPLLCFGEFETTEGCGNCQSCMYIVETYNKEYEACPFECSPELCKCKTGYFRDANGNCVPPNECLLQAGISMTMQ